MEWLSQKHLRMEWAAGNDQKIFEADSSWGVLYNEPIYTTSVIPF